MPRSASSPDPSSNLTVRASAAASANGSTPGVVIHGAAGGAVVYVNVTAIVGTLDVTVEDSPDGVIWGKAATLPQITATGTYRVLIPAPLGAQLRLSWVVGGATPSATFSAIARTN